MVVTFELKGFTISDPIEGKRCWSAKLQADNLDTGVVYDNTATTLGNPLLLRLREYGSSLVIRHISVLYEGAFSGMALCPALYTSDDTLAFLECKQTGRATDACDWPGLYVPGTFKKLYHYLCRVTVTGYAATDDMTLTIHGEVW